MVTRKRLGYQIYRALWSGLDWLYPPLCGGCGKRGSRWCPDCAHEARIIVPPICQICGQKINSSRICSRCEDEPPDYTALRSWAAFVDPVRAAVHKLKYRRDIALGEALSRPLIKYLIQLNWDIDLVVPVPMSVAHIKERGYNQAVLLAKPIALRCGLEYKSKALLKVRETLKQVGLSLPERRKNLEGAFKVNGAFVAKKNILIVDDVVTSGSTMEACSDVLLAEGANKVYGLTLARVI